MNHPCPRPHFADGTYVPGRKSLTCVKQPAVSIRECPNMTLGMCLCAGGLLRLQSGMTDHWPEHAAWVGLRPARHPRSLSDLRLIYCAGGKSGPFSPDFSLHRPTMRLEIVKNCPRSPTRLATIAQVRQAPSGAGALGAALRFVEGGEKKGGLRRLSTLSNRADQAEALPFRLAIRPVVVCSSHWRMRLASPMRESLPHESSSTMITFCSAICACITRQWPASLM